jgi:alkylhydroperoxidase family enzyme
VIDDPRGAPRDPRTRAISGLAQLVTEAPWTLSRADFDRARDAGLDDATVLHVIALSSFFGYLNRVADAVGIELDYDVAVRPPPPDPETPPWPRPSREQWPDPFATRRITLAMRVGAVEALGGWLAHVMERKAPLSRAQRALIARAAAATVGDASVPAGPPATTPVDRALVELTETIALAPWRLGAAALAPLRAAGLDDLAIFDAISVAAFANFGSRLSVALAALAA